MWHVFVCPEEVCIDWCVGKQEMIGGVGLVVEIDEAEIGKRKYNEGHFIEGCLITFGALSYGLWSFRQGQRKMSQYMMRLRIGAQGFTVVALIAGIGMSAVGPRE